MTGGVFWSGSVAAAGGADRWTVDEHLHTLERKAFVRRSGDASVDGESGVGLRARARPGCRLRGDPASAQAEKHLRVAGWIESLGSGRTTTPSSSLTTTSRRSTWARPRGSTCGGLGTRARRGPTGRRPCLALHAFAAAAAFYRRALDLTSETDSRARPLLLKLGRSLCLSEGGGEEELLSALDALRETGDARARRRRSCCSPTSTRSAGKAELYERHLAAATSLAGELGPSPVKAHALLAISARTRAETATTSSPSPSHTTRSH